MQVASGGRLRQDTSQSEVGGVSFDGQGQVGIEMQQDGGRGKGVLQSTESRLCRYRLGEFDCLACQGGKGECQGGIAIDKLSVEVGEPQK